MQYVKECVSEGGKPFTIAVETEYGCVSEVLERSGYVSTSLIEKRERSASRSKSIKDWLKRRWCFEHKCVVNECGCVKVAVS